jgi:hypothetical protein
MIYVYKGIKGEPYYDLQILGEDQKPVGFARHITTENKDAYTYYKFKGPSGIVAPVIMLKMTQTNNHTSFIGQAVFVDKYEE